MTTERETIKYAALHQAISGVTKLVCVPARYRAEEVRKIPITPGTELELVANDKFGSHPAVTRWRVIGSVQQIGPNIPDQMVAFMKALWPVAEWWLSTSDRAWWFRAELIPDDDGWMPQPEDLLEYIGKSRKALGLPD